MTARISEESGGFGEIEGKKTDQRARGEKGHGCHQILPLAGRDQTEPYGADGPHTGAKPVHIIHEIEGVYHGQYPQRRDAKTEDQARHEKSDANARRRDDQGRDELAAEFDGRRQFGFVIEQADEKHPERPRSQTQKAHRAHTQTVFEEPGDA